MRALSKLALGWFCAGATTAAVLALQRLPIPSAEPLRLACTGETLRDVPIEISQTGTYEIALEVLQAKRGMNETPTAPYLHAEVRRGGVRIDKPSQGGSWGEETYDLRVGHFKATKGETERLTIASGSSLKGLRGRTLHVIVKQLPLDYAWYFIVQMALEGLAVLFAILCLVSLAVAGAIFRSGRRSRIEVRGLNTS